MTPFSALAVLTATGLALVLALLLRHRRHLARLESRLRVLEYKREVGDSVAGVSSPTVRPEANPPLRPDVATGPAKSWTPMNPFQ